MEGQTTYKEAHVERVKDMAVSKWVDVQEVMRIVGNVAAITAVFVLTLLVGIPLIGILWLMNAVAPRRVEARRAVHFFFVKHAWARPILWLMGTSLTIEGEEHLDDNKRYFFAANHGSLYDVMVMYALRARPFAWVMKDNPGPIVRPLGVYSGQVIVTRTNTQRDIRAMSTAVPSAMDCDVVVFPEGTRTRDGALRPFKRGLFHQAANVGEPIVVMAITGSYETLPAVSPLDFVKGLQRGTPIVVRFSRPIDTRGATHEELLSRVQTLMQEMLRG